MGRSERIENTIFPQMYIYLPTTAKHQMHNNDKAAT
jgi:hypothetical protein